jgi:AraC-like DNA-binding protein
VESVQQYTHQQLLHTFLRLLPQPGTILDAACDAGRYMRYMALLLERGHSVAGIDQSQGMLAAGQPIAEVALATGFTDQSHLTRWFTRLWGFTPGQYRNSVQDG